jgi:hypothetical protein
MLQPLSLCVPELALSGVLELPVEAEPFQISL